MKISIYLNIVLILIISCTGKEEAEILNFNDGDHFYLIIPVHGCNGCIAKSKRFVSSNLNNPLITFVITSYTTPKDVRLNLGDDLLKSKAVLLDTKNQLIKDGYSSDFPTIVYKENDQIVFIELTAEIISQELSLLNKKISEET